MRAIAVDDEIPALAEMRDILKDISDITQFETFSNGETAIEWAKKHQFDIAFLDIDLGCMSGLELAKALRDINRRCYIIFCSGHGEYMPDAFKLHANAYLMKPILPDELQRELDYFKNLNKSDKLLTIKSIGGFEVYDADGNLVRFKRSKVKELFALLVDRRGMSITSREICVKLWEDDGVQDKKNMAYLWKLMNDLNHMMSDLGVADVIKKNGLGYYVDMDMVDFDAMDITTDEHYMEGYEWAHI